eukprot:jgi/Mesvir1/24372/Mv11043-RA.1
MHTAGARLRIYSFLVLIASLLASVTQTIGDPLHTCHLDVIHIKPHVVVKARQERHPGYGALSPYSCHLSRSEQARLNVRTVRLHPYRPFLTCEGEKTDTPTLEQLRTPSSCSHLHDVNSRQMDVENNNLAAANRVRPDGSHGSSQDPKGSSQDSTKLEGKGHPNAAYTDADDDTNDNPDATNENSDPTKGNSGASDASTPVDVAVGIWGSCALVLNAQRLLNSTCGDAINGYDTVIRLNGAPVVGYEADVGNRTDIHFMNWQVEKQRFQPNDGSDDKSAGINSSNASNGLNEGNSGSDNGKNSNSSTRSINATGSAAREPSPGLLVLNDDHLGAARRNADCRKSRDLHHQRTLTVDNMRYESTTAMLTEMMAPVRARAARNTIFKPTTGFRVILISAQFCTSLAIFGQGNLSEGHYFAPKGRMWVGHSFDGEATLLRRWEAQGGMSVEVYDDGPEHCSARFSTVDAAAYQGVHKKIPQELAAPFDFTSIFQGKSSGMMAVRLREAGPGDSNAACGEGATRAKSKVLPGRLKGLRGNDADALDGFVTCFHA